MKFECLLLLMVSTVSFHFDSFIAKIDAIFPFLVAWKRARKVDESLERPRERLIFWRLFSRLPFGWRTCECMVASSHFPRSRRERGLQDCFALLFLL